MNLRNFSIEKKVVKNLFQIKQQYYNRGYESVAYLLTLM